MRSTTGSHRSELAVETFLPPRPPRIFLPSPFHKQNKQTLLFHFTTHRKKENDEVLRLGGCFSPPRGHAREHITFCHDQCGLRWIFNKFNRNHISTSSAHTTSTKGSKTYSATIRGLKAVGLSLSIWPAPQTRKHKPKKKRERRRKRIGMLVFFLFYL